MEIWNFTVLRPSCLFWFQKWAFWRVTDTQLLFGNKQYPNDVKKTYLTFIAICSRVNCYIFGLLRNREKLWNNREHFPEMAERLTGILICKIIFSYDSFWLLCKCCFCKTITSFLKSEKSYDNFIFDIELIILYLLAPY